mmetsp:Transcript_46967/g.70980  ORF Transcript_46967/g.70980 Transcript_46967/m.70980 type:complete len:370 (+) Transcript_46967:57-1166(+)
MTVVSGLGLLGFYVLLAAAVFDIRTCNATIHAAFSVLSSARVAPVVVAGKKTLYVSLKDGRNPKRLSVGLNSVVGGDKSELDAADEKMVKRRYRRLATEYHIASLASFVTATLPLVILFGGSATAQPISFFLYAMSGPLLATTVSHNLGRTALQKNLPPRMSKRLALALIAYSLLGTFAFALVRPMDRRYLVPTLLSSLITILPASKDFLWALRGPSSRLRTIDVLVADLRDDLTNGVKATARSMLHFNNASNAGYLAAAFFVFAALLLKLADIISMFASHGLQTPDIAFAIASEVTTYAKLTLFSAVVFTLKDAADEKRMKGMVFIQMNLVSSFIFGVISGKPWLGACNFSSIRMFPTCPDFFARVHY